MLRHISFALAILSLLSGVSIQARADDGLDLRGKFIEFSKAALEKRGKVEDQMRKRERDFQDGITLEFREGQTKGLDEVANAPNWHEAQRTYRDQIRHLTSELRQKIRVHREEFQLTLLAANNDLDKDLKDFLTPLDQEFRSNQSAAYKKAESDFQSSREDLRDDLSKWKDRMKEVRTPDDFIPY